MVSIRVGALHPPQPVAQAPMDRATGVQPSSCMMKVPSMLGKNRRNHRRLSRDPRGDEVQDFLEFVKGKNDSHGHAVKQQPQPDHGGGRGSGFVASLLESQLG